MNILFFSRSLPSHRIGGMELVALDVAVGLAEKGHNIKIITTSLSQGDRYSIPELPEHLTIEYLENTKPGIYSRGWWQASRAAYFREKDRFKPDIVFSISAGARSVLPVLGGVPVLMQAHGTSFGEFRSKLRSGRFIHVASSIKNLMSVPPDFRIYRRVQKIVAVGPNVYDALGHLFIRWVLPIDKVVMIPNGVDTEMFRPNVDLKMKKRRQLGIPSKAKVLVWASRLHRQKGAHLALEAFSRLNRDDTWLLVIGDGPERNRLEKQSDETGISDRVAFVGPVPHGEIPGYLSAGDVFIFTTMRDEGLPLNTLEALSVGLPCVMSRNLTRTLKGVNDLEGVFAVNPVDIPEVIGAMHEALNFNETEHLHSFIEHFYSRKVMIDRYEELLTDMVNQNV